MFSAGGHAEAKFQVLSSGSSRSRLVKQICGHNRGGLQQTHNNNLFFTVLRLHALILRWKHKAVQALISMWGQDPEGDGISCKRRGYESVRQTWTTHHTGKQCKEKATGRKWDNKILSLTLFAQHFTPNTVESKVFYRTKEIKGWGCGYGLTLSLIWSSVIIKLVCWYGGFVPANCLRHIFNVTHNNGLSGKGFLHLARLCWVNHVSSWWL